MVAAADSAHRLPGKRSLSSPLPPSVLCFLVALWLHPAAACLKTAWTSGLMSPESAHLLETVTATSSCGCCAECHRRPDCASLAFHAAGDQCRLYGAVASYDTLHPDAEWLYLVRPGRSRDGQFCRLDSDCPPGVPCRGRVCTQRRNITCRAIRDELGAGDRFGAPAARTAMFGWLADRPLALACLFSAERPGYTRLFRNSPGFRFTRQTVTAHNADLAEGVQRPHSILRLAEQLRQLRADSPYRLLVESPGQVAIEFSVPRPVPVLATEPRWPVGVSVHHEGRSSGSNVSLPYLPAQDVTLLSVNGLDPKWYQLALAREDGSLTWEGSLDPLCLYILE